MGNSILIKQFFETFSAYRIQENFFVFLRERTWFVMMISHNYCKPSCFVLLIKVSELVSSDAILIFPASTVIKRQFMIHKNLVHVYCSSSFINHYRFCILGAFTNCNAAFPNDIDFETVLWSVLNYLSAVHFSTSDAYDKVANKVLLTSE